MPSQFVSLGSQDRGKGGHLTSSYGRATELPKVGECLKYCKRLICIIERLGHVRTSLRRLCTRPYSVLAEKVVQKFFQLLLLALRWRWGIGGEGRCLDVGLLGFP